MTTLAHLFRAPAVRVTALAAMLLLSAPAGAQETVAVDVVVEGVSADVRANVLASLSIYQERKRDDLTAARIRRLHDRAVDEIRAALQPFGYYRPQVKASLNREQSRWSARYYIDPGAPVTVANVDVRVVGEGAEDPQFRKLVEDFPLKRGEPLNHQSYEQAKRAFQGTALERGYFDHRLQRHEVTVDLETTYTADVYLHIDTGRRYRFGMVTLEQDVLSPAFLARYVRLEPGQPYSTAALLELQAALSGSDYFSSVEVIADPESAQDYTIPVRVRLTPRKPNKYTFGLGYGTDTGARGQLGWERRYLNAKGHHVRTELRASRIERSLNTGYFIPIRDPRTDQIAFTAGYTETDVNATDTEVRRVAASRTTQRGRLQETLSLTRQNEKFVIGSQTGSSELLLPGVTWSHFLGQDRIYTRAGARTTLDLRVADDRVASDTTLAQARLQSKLILPVLDFGRLIMRAEAGTTHIDTFERLPPSLRFFAGGDVSVRGYRYNTLGPQQADGTVIGGKHLLVGSVEYEQRLSGNWAAAVFFDAGNALNEFSDPLKKGAGLGLRYRTPVGQIRVDVASPLSNPDESLRLHISIGPDL